MSQSRRGKGLNQSQWQWAGTYSRDFEEIPRFGKKCSLRVYPVKRKYSELCHDFVVSEKLAGKLDVFVNTGYGVDVVFDTGQSKQKKHVIEYYKLDIPSPNWSGSSNVIKQPNGEVTSQQRRSDALQINALLNEKTSFSWEICYDTMANNLGFITDGTFQLADLRAVLQEFRQKIYDNEAYNGLMDQVQKFMPIQRLFHFMAELQEKNIFARNELFLEFNLSNEKAEMSYKAVMHDKESNGKFANLQAYFEKMAQLTAVASHTSPPNMELQVFKMGADDHAPPSFVSGQTTMYTGARGYSSGEAKINEKLFFASSSSCLQFATGSRWAAVSVISGAVSAPKGLAQPDPKLKDLIKDFGDDEQVKIAVTIANPFKSKTSSSGQPIGLPLISQHPSVFIGRSLELVDAYEESLILRPGTGVTYIPKKPGQAHPCHKYLQEKIELTKKIIERIRKEDERLRSSLERLLRFPQQSNSETPDDTKEKQLLLDQIQRLLIFITEIDKKTFDIFHPLLPSLPCLDHDIVQKIKRVRRNMIRKHRNMLILMLLDEHCQELIYSQAEYLCLLIAILENKYGDEPTKTGMVISPLMKKVTFSAKNDVKHPLRQLPFRPFSNILSMLGCEVGTQKPGPLDVRTLYVIHYYFKEYPYLSRFFQRGMYKCEKEFNSFISSFYIRLVREFLTRHTDSPLSFTNLDPDELTGLPRLVRTFLQQLINAGKMYIHQISTLTADDYLKLEMIAEFYTEPVDIAWIIKNIDTYQTLLSYKNDDLWNLPFPMFVPELRTFLQQLINAGKISIHQISTLTADDYLKLEMIAEFYTEPVDIAWIIKNIDTFQTLLSFTKDQLKNLAFPVMVRELWRRRLAVSSDETLNDPLTNAVAVRLSLSHSPHTLFFSYNGTMRKLHEEYLIENRHKTHALQHAYDKLFGLVMPIQRDHDVSPANMW